MLEHFGFLLALGAMLLAPRLSIGLSAVQEYGSSRSAPSIGIAGFLLWIIACPRYLRRFQPRYTLGELASRAVIALGMLMLCVALADCSGVAVAYSLQWLVYAVVSRFMFVRYFRQALQGGHFRYALRLVRILAVVFACGAYWSVIVGPIYPSSQIAERIFDGTWMTSATGFGENVNGTGGIIAALLPLTLCFPEGHPRRSVFWTLVCVQIGALLLTTSRSALLAALAAGIAGLLIEFAAPSRRKRTARSGFLGLTILLLIVLIIPRTPLGQKLESVSPTLGMLDLKLSGGQGVLDEDVQLRTQFWQRGLDYWSNLSLGEKLLGVGFRNSMDRELAWITFHNFYIVLMSEAGLLGVGILLGGVGTYWIRSLLQIARNRKRNIVHFAALCSVAAIFVHNISEVFLYSPVYVVLLQMILQLSSSAVRAQATVPARHIRRARLLPSTVVGGEAAC